MNDLQHIEAFLQEHHVLSLATNHQNNLSVCSLFYAYDKETYTFIVASSEETQHIQNIVKNNTIAGNILLETKEVNQIQGVQFKGTFIKLDDERMKNIYFNTFEYALVMKPQLWKIEVSLFKMTDNTLGFGKKLIWKNKTTSKH